jgi:small-conductance mechanosensitive channel
MTTRRIVSLRSGRSGEEETLSGDSLSTFLEGGPSYYTDSDSASSLLAAKPSSEDLKPTSAPAGARPAPPASAATVSGVTGHKLRPRPSLSLSTKEQRERHRTQILTLVLLSLGVGAVLVSIGAALTYTPRLKVKLVGVSALRWGIYVTVVMFSGFVGRVVASAVLALLGVPRILRIVWYVLEHMESMMASAVWLGCAWGLSWPVLGRDKLSAFAAEGMDRFYFAVAISIAVFVLRRVALLLLQVHIFRPLRLRIQEARIIDRFMIMVTMGRSPSNEDTALMKASEPLGAGAIGALHAVGVAGELTRRGLAAFSSALKPGISALPAKEQEEYVARLAATLFDLVAADEVITEPALTTLLTSRHNAAGGFSRRKARFLFELMDGDDDDLITYANAEEAFGDLLQKRTALLNDLWGSTQFVRITGDMLMVTSVCVVIFLFLDVVGISAYSVLIPATSIILSLSFGLRDFAGNLFMGLHFLFFRRPYELGDRVSIDDGPDHIVQGISVLFTTFTSITGFQVTISNSVLASKKLANFKRSTTTTVSLSYAVTPRFTQADLAAFRDLAKDFVSQNPKKMLPDVSVSLDVNPAGTTLLLAVSAVATVPWQDRDTSNKLKAKMNSFLVSAMEARGVEWGVDLTVARK